MRNLLCLLAISISATVFGQTAQRVGTFALKTVTSGADPTWSITGTYISGVGFDASTGVQVGDWLVARYVNGTTHARNIYSVTAISSAGVQNLAITVTRISGIPTAYFPPGTHAIAAHADGLIYDVPNVSQELNGS